MLLERGPRPVLLLGLLVGCTAAPPSTSPSLQPEPDTADSDHPPSRPIESFLVGNGAGLCRYNLAGELLERRSKAPARFPLLTDDAGVLFISPRATGDLELRSVDARGERVIAKLPQLFDSDSCRAEVADEAILDADAEETQWLTWLEVPNREALGMDLDGRHACLRLRSREDEAIEIELAVGLDGEIESRVVHDATGKCSATEFPGPACQRVRHARPPTHARAAPPDSPRRFEYDEADGWLRAEGDAVARLCTSDEADASCLIHEADAPNHAHALLLDQRVERGITHASPFVLDRSDGSLWTVVGSLAEVVEVPPAELYALSRACAMPACPRLLGPSSELVWLSSTRLWLDGVLWLVDERDAIRLDGELVLPLERGAD